MQIYCCRSPGEDKTNDADHLFGHYGEAGRKNDDPFDQVFQFLYILQSKDISLFIMLFRVIKILKDTPGRLHRQRGWQEEGETSFQRECNPRPSAQETCPKNGCHMNHIARDSPCSKKDPCRRRPLKRGNEFFYPPPLCSFQPNKILKVHKQLLKVQKQL